MAKQTDGEMPPPVSNFAKKQAASFENSVWLQPQPDPAHLPHTVGRIAAPLTNNTVRLAESKKRVPMVSRPLFPTAGESQAQEASP